MKHTLYIPINLALVPVKVDDILHSDYDTMASCEGYKTFDDAKNSEDYDEHCVIMKVSCDDYLTSTTGKIAYIYPLQVTEIIDTFKVGDIVYYTYKGKTYGPCVVKNVYPNNVHRILDTTVNEYITTFKDEPLLRRADPTKVIKSYSMYNPDLKGIPNIFLYEDLHTTRTFINPLNLTNTFETFPYLSEEGEGTYKFMTSNNPNIVTH